MPVRAFATSSLGGIVSPQPEQTPEQPNILENKGLKLL